MACPGGMFGGEEQRWLGEMMSQAAPILQEFLGPVLAQAAQAQTGGPDQDKAGATSGAGPQCDPCGGDNPWATLCQNYQEMMQKCAADAQAQWTTKVQLRGFQAGEIHVKVDPEERTVKVQAQHESGDEHGFDRREAARYIRVPDDVIAESIRVSHRPNGDLVVSGKRESKQNEDEKKQESDGESVKISRKAASEEPKENQTDVNNTKKFQFLVTSDDKNEGKTVPIDTEQGEFAVELDVSSYKPEQLAVKVSGDQLTITTRKQGDQDGGLHRKYTLPSHVDADGLKSTLSPEGVLRVAAPSVAKETKVAIEVEKE